ncbi:MAG: ATP-binding protein [Candidatus Micrarchaeota archaeon]
MSPDRRRITPLMLKRLTRLSSPSRFRAYKAEPDALKEPSPYLSSLIERTDEVMLLVDPSGKISKASGSAKSLFGIADGSASMLAELIPSQDIRCASLMLKRALLFGSSRTLDWISIRGRDGQNRSYIASATRIVNEPPRLLIIAREAPSQEQLALSAAAHDVKSLLSPSLNLASELLCDAHAGAELRSLAEDAITSINRSIQLLDDAMRYSAPVSQESKKVDVHSLIKLSIRRAMSRQTIHSDAPRYTFALSVPPGDYAVSGSPPALERVFVNLFINAMDAMPGGGTIDVSLAQDGRSICVSVADAGMGIAKESLDRIFDPYFTTKGERGNGLGLAIVKKFVEAHGGRITVESDPGLGTAFSISFPKAAESDAIG